MQNIKNSIQSKVINEISYNVQQLITFNCTSRINMHVRIRTVTVRLSNYTRLKFNLKNGKYMG